MQKTRVNLNFKISKRERTALATLLVIIIFWGYDQFVLSNQLDKIENLRNKHQEYKIEVEKINTILVTEYQIDAMFEELVENTERISKNYFSDIRQEAIILILDQFIKESGIGFSNISFTPIRSEPMGENFVDAMQISFPYVADYGSLIDFLRVIRNFDKKIIVNDLVMGMIEDDIITGNISLDFYSITNALHNETVLMIWDYDGHGRDNPFSKFEEYEEYEKYEDYEEHENYLISLEHLDEVIEEIIYEDGIHFDSFDPAMVRIQIAHNQIPEKNTVQSETFIYYEVRPGDTLYSISRKFYNNDVSKRSLIIDYNNIIDENQLEAGKVLIIPKAFSRK